MAGDLT